MLEAVVANGIIGGLCAGLLVAGFWLYDRARGRKGPPLGPPTRTSDADIAAPARPVAPRASGRGTDRGLTLSGALMFMAVFVGGFMPVAVLIISGSLTDVMTCIAIGTALALLAEGARRVGVNRNR
jgi:hypothetical protein